MQVTLGALQTDVSGSTLAEQIISTAELKKHLRVTHSLEDTLIEAARLAAISYVENYTNVLLGSYSATGYLRTWQFASFPVGPLTAVGAVKYDDASGTEQTFSASSVHYDINREPAQIYFQDVPSHEDYNLTPVRVEFTAGFAPADIPETIISAIKLIVGHLYDMRTDEVTGTITTRIKLGTDALLNAHRIIAQP
ncbi:MAG: head-tail connector protein [Luminiphilus sp.]